MKIINILSYISIFLILCASIFDYGGHELVTDNVILYAFSLLSISVFLNLINFDECKIESRIKRLFSKLNIEFAKKYRDEILSVAFAVTVYGYDVIKPGYVMSLDMIWSPYMTAIWSTDSYNNNYIVLLIVSMFSGVLASVLFQKLVLLGLFFLLFYIPLRCLPFINDYNSRVFAAIVFAANPLVFARLLAGQWIFLYGYAMLPLLLSVIYAMYTSPSKRSASNLGLIFAVVAMFSIHIAYMVLLIYFAVFVIWYANKLIYENKYVSLNIKPWLWASLVFITLNLYWLIPAVLRDTPAESGFDIRDYVAFAASSNGGVSILLNLIATGGFWGEGKAFAYHFLWPQSLIFFWSGLFFIILICLYGLKKIYGISKKSALFISFVYIAVLILSAGLADTIFYKINYILYTYMPLYGGMRDSTKWLAVMGLIYAFLFGFGAESILNKYKVYRYKIMLFIVVVLLAFSKSMIGVISTEIAPVVYPKGWYIAKDIIENGNGKTLVLPWHGYLSVDFADNRLVANPASIFFDNNKVIVSKSIEIMDVYDHQNDETYKKIDQFLMSDASKDRDLLLRFLKENNINKVLIIKNRLINNSESGLTKWTEYDGLEDESGDEFGAKNMNNTQNDNWKNILEEKAINIFSDEDLTIKEIVN